MSKQFLILSGLLITFLLSCAKEPIQAPKNETNQADVPVFYLDGKQVPENTFQLDDATLYLGITNANKMTGGEYMPVFNAFTTKENYISWGEKNNYKVAMMFEIQEHLSQYAVEKGVIDEYEHTGIVPLSYLEYEKSFILRMKKKHNVLVNDSRAPALLRNTCGVVNDYFIMDTAPVLPSHHNNSVSAVWTFAPLVYHAIYDRTFYRALVGTYWDFDANPTCFIGYLSQFDNIMSSVVLL